MTKKYNYTPTGKKTLRKPAEEKDFEKWMEKARSVTPDTFKKFIDDLMKIPMSYTAYIACMAACMKAGVEAVEHASGGGTGHQFDVAVMYFAQNVLNRGMDIGLQLIDLDHVLYGSLSEGWRPFGNATVRFSKSAWEKTMRVAQEKIDEYSGNKKVKKVSTNGLPNIPPSKERIRYWKSLAGGVVPASVVVE